tara:strand:+ start:912 stop:1352 length:441 start_codon:yes stop_codon:yes gene_type:complete
MSSLNINNLYETSYQKNIQRLENFDNVLKKIHNRIKYNAKTEKTFCFYQIPEFIFGVPLYNIDDLKQYIMNSLKKDGFKIIYMDPNWLFITWEINKPETKKINQMRKSSKDKNKGDFKLVDEYKPQGQFYNEYDLTSMRDKTKNLF